MFVNNKLTRALARFLVPRIEAYTRRHVVSFTIGRDGSVYMERWWMLPKEFRIFGKTVQNELFNVYIHRFWRDDNDVPHDHPWASVSLLLGQELLEADVNGNVTPMSFGAMVFRGPTTAHRVIVPRPGTLTLFLRGPKVRDWGFHCPNGWKIWRDFVAADQPGEIGRGCGE